MAQVTYITIAELAEACDARALEEFGSDTGTPLSFSTTPAVGDDTQGILTNAIERASADVESSALRGGRYSATDLVALQTADDWTLKSIVADLAFGYLNERRGGVLTPDADRKMKAARDTLKSLRDGDRIFNHAESIDAGKPSIAVINATTRANLSLASDSPFFPHANTRVY